MHYNDDARAELREVLELTREFLQQQMAAGKRTIDLRPGTRDTLNEGAQRAVPPAQDAARTAVPAADFTGALLGGDLSGFTTLDALREYTSTCEKCGLCTDRTQVVFGVGSPTAKLVFVGEAPGRDEDRQGEPFVGRAGQLLTRIIETMLKPWTRADVYICNVIKCRPPENRDPRPEEIWECEPYLLRQLELLQPAVIVTLGKFAAQTLLKDKTGMMRLRGTWREYHGIPLMPVVHPAYVLRNPNEGRRLMFDDMTSVRERLEGLGLL